ncbi:hypothetical protein AVEN_104260-1 [Araneus ventricosus]|uniref:Uncharacterized protein n=1 Tax=Araneus ventricosus TaxID=182803 RepID=A0A4Y2LXC6_ARAVE|nr:hypothetical protein AVEN_104260-1 [Araneus ventricosus]
MKFAPSFLSEVIQEQTCLQTYTQYDIYTYKDHKNITPSCKSIRVNLKDRPPRRQSQALRFLHYSPHYEWLMQQPPDNRGTICLRGWGQRATTPLLYHRVGGNQLTYMAACHQVNSLPKIRVIQSH